MRSKDLMPKTGNKFNDLFSLGKIMAEQKKDYQEKSTAEYEFEKAARECTFKPQINSSATKMAIRNRSPEGSTVLAVKGTQKQFERMKAARER